MKLDIYDTLEKLKGKQLIERKPPVRIYLDEKTGQIREEPLDSAGASLVKVNVAKLIHDSIIR